MGSGCEVPLHGHSSSSVVQLYTVWEHHLHRREAGGVYVLWRVQSSLSTDPWRRGGRGVTEGDREQGEGREVA